ncbi:transposase [Azospirillum brasilense]|nr:transposase [Azospirillum brasilense]
MWTKAHRVKQAGPDRRSQRYPTDLTDTEWILIEPWLPRPAKRGRRRGVDLREVLSCPLNQRQPLSEGWANQEEDGTARRNRSSACCAPSRWRWRRGTRSARPAA